MKENSLANPGPLGLAAFGMTTVLLNLHNAGFLPLTMTVLAMGLCYGGLAQIVAGIISYKRNEVFPATAFTSYGFFWLTLVIIWYFPANEKVGAASLSAMSAYLFIWGLFTLFLFIGTRGANFVLRFIFATLTILFFLLALGDYLHSPFIGKIAGYEGLVCGASAIYLAMAELLNEKLGRVVLPIGD
ncbi:acetate uptake transporter [Bartonella sp. DGB1]|uniref:acetate uptake transporter n=1 Tax=Bartonella sp. DGB1 TaxID=3239807 RepID=UPI003526B250